MPYKDPEAKCQWELRHRTERLARRRELRRIQSAQPTQHKSDAAGTGVLVLPILAGGALAAYNPKVALGAGGLTLLAAIYYRKGWQFWLVGVLTILFALAFWNWDREPGVARNK